MTQHQFFQSFGGQQQQQPTNVNPEIAHNEMVFEIHNNWEHVLDLVKRISEEKVETVDRLQAEWLNFINTNQLNMNTFENAEDFVEKTFKINA